MQSEPPVCSAKGGSALKTLSRGNPSESCNTRGQLTGNDEYYFRRPLGNIEGFVLMEHLATSGRSCAKIANLSLLRNIHLLEEIGPGHRPIMIRHGHILPEYSEPVNVNLLTH